VPDQIPATHGPRAASWPGISSRSSSDVSLTNPPGGRPPRPGPSLPKCPPLSPGPVFRRFAWSAARPVRKDSRRGLFIQGRDNSLALRRERCSMISAISAGCRSSSFSVRDAQLQPPQGVRLDEVSQTPSESSPAAICLCSLRNHLGRHHSLQQPPHGSRESTSTCVRRSSTVPFVAKGGQIDVVHTHDLRLRVSMIC